MTYEKQALVRYLLPKFLRIQKFGDFWAVRGVSFQLERGSVLGVIGPNGAGKSTLLNLCSGITAPTEGEIKVGGKVASLLTLGAGFHNDLTGEENVYLNGAILGLTIKEIRRKIDDIIRFSELGSLIEAPLQTYSAGMMMRIGFAIAIHADFDILVIDEIMAVGDGAFQRKCYAKLQEFKELGKGIILASHGLETIETFCDRVLLLEAGRQVAYGDSSSVVAVYRKRMNGNGDSLLTPAEKKRILLSLHGSGKSKSRPIPSEINWVRGAWRQRFGMGKARIEKVQLLDKDSQQITELSSGDLLKIRVEYQVEEPIYDPHFGVAIYRDDGVYCFGPNTRFDGIPIDQLSVGKGWFQITYPRVSLLTGRFSLTIAIWEKEEIQGYDYHHGMYPFKIRSNHSEYGVTSLSHQWMQGGKDLASQGNLMIGHSFFQKEMEERIGLWLKNRPIQILQNGMHLESFRITQDLDDRENPFVTGDTMVMKGSFTANKPVDQVAIWIGIFRKDGILCYGMSSLADGVLLEFQEGKNNDWGIRFPMIPLLRGQFKVVVAWMNLHQDIWGVIPEAGLFEIKETLLHHGLVLMEREWRSSAFGWRKQVGRLFYGTKPLSKLALCFNSCSRL